MNRYIFSFVFFLMLFSCIAIPLPQANEKEPANAFVTKVKGLGLLLNAFQTPDGYVTLSRKMDKSDTVVLREISNSGQRILEKELSIIPPHNYFSGITGFAQTVDGYVFIGFRYSFEYGNIYESLFKLNKNGSYEWSKNFPHESGTLHFNFSSVISKPDGGFVVIGRQHQPNAVLLISFASNGHILWNNRIKNFLADTYYSQQVSDGIILTSGRKIIKINDSGDIVWKQRLDIKDFHISSLGPARNDNGVVIAGKSGISTQLMLIHLDANGKVDWKETYSHSADIDIVASTLLPVSDGYLIGGKTLKGGGNGVLFKINDKREVVLQKGFGDRGNQNVHSVFTRNGGYVLIGSTSTDMLIVGLNSNGVVPGCSLVYSLKITKVASPPVTAEKLGIGSGEFVHLRTSGTIGINITDSKSPTVSMCQ